MSVNFNRLISKDVTVNGYGDVTFTSSVTIPFNTLMHIQAVANAHKGSYGAYMNRDETNDELYNEDFEYLMK